MNEALSEGAGVKTDDDEWQAILDGTAYRATGRLGRGGMGLVLGAEHVALRKAVVVKILHEELSRREDLVDRMRVEAQVLARLRHTNVVDVTDFGQTRDGRPFFVMERLRGRTLREELAARGRLSPAEAVEWVRQALAGLAAAHDAGIVHRDVKLDNLFLCDAEAGGARFVKVLDFGIAKVLGDQGDDGVRPVAQPTETGALMGTPRFLSPEQARGLPLDARTDIYASCIVLYALIAGRGPFHDLSNPIQLLQAHAFHEPPPPSSIATQPVGMMLEREILRGLAKRREDRHATARQLSEALAAALRADAAPVSDTQVLPQALPAIDVRPAVVRAASPAAPPAAFTGRGTIRMPDAPVVPFAHAPTDPAGPESDSMTTRPQQRSPAVEAQPTAVGPGRPGRELVVHEGSRKPRLMHLLAAALGSLAVLTAVIEIARRMVGK